MDIRTIVHIDRFDVAVGMTVTYTFDGTHHGSTVASIDHDLEHGSILWLSNGNGLFVSNGQTVSVEI